MTKRFIHVHTKLLTSKILAYQTPPSHKHTHVDTYTNIERTYTCIYIHEHKTYIHMYIHTQT